MVLQETQLNFLCIVCDGELTINSDVELNELLDCDDCGSELEIVSINPLQVEEIECDGEDWGQ